MKRRLFTILSTLSLVLCLACAGAWVRTGSTFDQVDRWHAGRVTTCLVSVLGRLEFMHQSEIRGLGADRPWSWRAASVHASMWRWEWPVYHAFTSTLADGSVVLTQEVLLPYWLPTLSAGILPSLWLCLWWRRPWETDRRQKAGLCRVCGYDLRASPERCPECGTPVPSPATSPASPPAPSP